MTIVLCQTGRLVRHLSIRLPFQKAIGCLLVFTLVATSACSTSTTPAKAPNVDVDSITVRTQVYQRRPTGALAQNRSDSISDWSGTAVESLFEGGSCMGIDCLLLPAFIGVYAAGGAVYGAAKGVSQSPNEVRRAVSTVSAAFRPAQVQTDLESTFLKELRRYAQVSGGPCIATESGPEQCKARKAKAGLVATFAFELVPSPMPNEPADLDITALVTAAGYPIGSLGIGCMSWLYRRYAGNLFDLDDDGGLLLAQRLQSSSVELANLVAAGLFEIQLEPPAGTFFERVNSGEQMCKINGEFAREIARNASR